MKSCFFVVAFCIAVGIAASSNIEEKADTLHVMEKRDTIFVKPPFPGCVFYECIASCRQKGNRRGGYCTINGCQCLR